MLTTELDNLNTRNFKISDKTPTVGASSNHLWPWASSYQLSKHARIRAQQRGIALKTIQIIATFCDRRKRVPGGMEALSLSTKEHEWLADYGLSSAELERTKNIRLIADPSSAKIITVEHAYRRRRFLS